jgi:Holliday junction resolvase RusA-like endonuclease
MTLRVEWEGKAIGENRRLGYSRKLGRNYPNPAYQAFIRDLTFTIILEAQRRKLHPRPLFRGEVCVRLDMELPPRMDHDALIKPCLDALARSNVLADDYQVRRSELERTRIRAKGQPTRIVMTVEGEEK